MNSAVMHNDCLWNYKFIFIIYLMAVYIGIGFFVIIIGFCIFVAIGSMRTHSGGEKLVKLEIIIQDFQVLEVVVAV